MTNSAPYDIINISRGKEVIKMDVWRDLYYDCFSADKYFNKQIEKHQKEILKLQKEIEKNKKFFKKI